MEVGIVGLTSLWQIGVLLSANRLIRLPLSPFIAWVYERFTIRTGMWTAVIIAIMTTFLYGWVEGFAGLLLVRCFWGIGWALFRMAGYLTVVTQSGAGNRGEFELNRETFLYAMGYHVISIGYDDVANQPELCKTLLRLVFSRVKPDQTATNLMALIEKEIILLAFQLARSIRPKDVVEHLPMNFRKAVRHLQSLCAKGWLRPVPSGRGSRILKYELIRRNLEGSVW